jgi:hypothetical protein
LRESRLGMVGVSDDKLIVIPRVRNVQPCVVNSFKTFVFHSVKSAAFPIVRWYQCLQTWAQLRRVFRGSLELKFCYSCNIFCESSTGSSLTMSKLSICCSWWKSFFWSVCFSVVISCLTCLYSELMKNKNKKKKK